MVPPTSRPEQNSILSAPASWAMRADSGLKHAISRKGMTRVRVVVVVWEDMDFFLYCR